MQEHNRRLNDKFYSMKLMKNDLSGLMVYIGLVDWAYKYTGQKSLIVKKEQDFSTCWKKKHCKKQCQDAALRKTKIQEKMLFT